MSHLLDEILSQAANGSPVTAALSSESVAVLFFASEFIERRENWVDIGVDPLDEVTDADWDAIEKLVGNVYSELMTPIDITPIGALAAWVMTTPPSKWLICNGQSLLRVDYADLFALIGTTFGAADSTHFYIPDLRDCSPMGAGTTVPLNGLQGSLLHAISPAEMPIHNHAVNDPGHTHPPGGGATTFWGVGSGTGVGAGTTSRAFSNTGSNTTGITTANAGSSNAMSILHPVRGVNFIIYAGV